MTAQYRQARTLLRRTREHERVYNDLHGLVTGFGLHERTAPTLLEALSGLRILNSSYRVSADISNNLASRDLKDLVEAGFLAPLGERRRRSYATADVVKQIRDRHRTAKGVEDPFANQFD